MSRGFVNYGRNFIVKDEDINGNVSVYRYDPGCATISPVFNNITRMMADIELFLDIQLDELPGYTADMFRVSRWAEWFEDETKFYSPYCEWFLEILRFSPECAKHDHGLLKLLNRFKTMVLTSTACVNGVWDYRAFYKKFLRGYPPLSQPTLAKRVWDMYVSCHSLAPPFHWFYIAFMGWMSRRPRHRKKYRFPKIEICNWWYYS